MDIVSTIISLVSGGIGGNVIGASWKETSLGAWGNTVAGVIGGAIGGYILQAVGVLHSLGLADMSVGSMFTNAGGAAISGAILTGVIGFIKNKMGK